MIFHIEFIKGCLFNKQPFLFIIGLFFLVAISGCSKETSTDQDIITEIEGERVNVEIFEAKYVRHLIQTGRNDTKKERYAFLNQFQDEVLLAKKAADSGFLDHPTYQRTITFAQRKAMVDFYFIDQMDERLEPATDEEVRLAYAKSKRKAYVRHLYSRDRNEIEQYYNRLLKGESFVDLANELFKTPAYDSLAGYIGPIGYYSVDDAFAEAAFSTNQGEFSKPVKSNFGFHIVLVEYLEIPTILTESDYQTRKSGIGSQVRLRNQELEANEYVNELMASLLVQVSEDNIFELKQVIDQLGQNNIVNNSNQNEQQSDNWQDSDFRQLQSAMDGATILGSFIYKGERVDFTFDDYLKWLPYLSYAESKARIGTSVGRGIRNEVFYMMASEEGYQEDERVKEEVKYKGYQVLSELYQRDLTRQALRDTTRVEIPEEVKQRFIGNRELAMDVEYWQFSISDVNGGLKAKAEMESGSLVPEKDPSFKEFSIQDLPDTDPKFSLLRKGIIDTPVIAFFEDEGWLILNVVKRDIRETGNSGINSLIQRRYKVYKYISDELNEIRDQAEVEIDTALFNKIYDLTKENKDS